MKIVSDIHIVQPIILFIIGPPEELAAQGGDTYNIQDYRLLVPGESQCPLIHTLHDILSNNVIYHLGCYGIMQSMLVIKCY